MTDTIALREKIKESGYKLVFIANKIGLTYQGFLKKLNNDSEFKANEIQGLCDLLRIDTGEKDLHKKGDIYEQNILHSEAVGKGRYP